MTLRHKQCPQCDFFATDHVDTGSPCYVCTSGVEVRVIPYHEEIIRMLFLSNNVPNAVFCTPLISMEVDVDE